MKAARKALYTFGVLWAAQLSIRALRYVHPVPGRTASRDSPLVIMTRFQSQCNELFCMTTDALSCCTLTKAEHNLTTSLLNERP
jgi:hypothetical protein